MNETQIPVYNPLINMGWTKDHSLIYFYNDTRRDKHLSLFQGYAFHDSTIAFRHICRPDDKQTAFKVVVPSIRALLCWDVFPKLTRKSNFPLLQLFIHPVSVRVDVLSCSSHVVHEYTDALLMLSSRLLSSSLLLKTAVSSAYFRC